MSSPAQQPRGGYLDRPHSSSLADVLDVILDKGLVIDAYVRLSLVGIEILTIDARIVVASVDTYLRFAEATNRLDLEATGGPTLVELFEEGVEKTIESTAHTIAEHKTEEAIETVKEKAASITEAVKKVFTGEHDDEDEEDDEDDEDEESST